MKIINKTNEVLDVEYKDDKYKSINPNEDLETELKGKIIVYGDNGSIVIIKDHRSNIIKQFSGLKANILGLDEIEVYNN